MIDDSVNPSQKHLDDILHNRINKILYTLSQLQGIRVILVSGI